MRMRCWGSVMFYVAQLVVNDRVHEFCVGANAKITIYADPCRLGVGNLGWLQR